MKPVIISACVNNILLTLCLFQCNTPLRIIGLEGRSEITFVNTLAVNWKSPAETVIMYHDSHLDKITMRTVAYRPVVKQSLSKQQPLLCNPHNIHASNNRGGVGNVVFYSVLAERL
jgi:hypothetical protein